MSGPIQPVDEECRNELLASIEAREGRTTSVGTVQVARVLPTKGRRTVGAWCFVDLMGSDDAEHPDPMEIGPHPHIGLSTATWLLEGEAVHTDSLGSEQVIRPGQLNLMTAGYGIAHAEIAAKPPFGGVQMWIAQPEDTRHGESAFNHHAELPQPDLDGATALLIVGSLAGATSPARTDTPLVGIDLSIHNRKTALPLTATFEHAVVPLDRKVKVGPEVVEPGWIALIPTGLEELPLETEQGDARLLVLGGEPFGEDVAMWWNFVARTRDELETAWRDWHDHTDRFGDPPSTLERIEAPVPPWIPAGS